MIEFSVLISVYHKERSHFLNDALLSIWDNQILKPSEIVLVKDGKLTIGLEDVIKDWKNKLGSRLKIVELETNVGLGQALNIGLSHCKYDIVARMDSDDISMSNRFQRQISFMQDNPEIAVIGSYLEEFNIMAGDLKRIRKVPILNQDIISFSRNRNPLNHPTVVFRKHIIESVGSYQKMSFFEDYYLWVRLLMNDYKIANIGETLLYFRVGNNMVGRRHGFKYVGYEIFFYFNLVRIRYINFLRFLFIIIPRIPIRLLPNWALKLFYRYFLRK